MLKLLPNTERAMDQFLDASGLGESDIYAMGAAPVSRRKLSPIFGMVNAPRKPANEINLNLIPHFT